MSRDLPPFGAMLRRYRQAARLSQDDLALKTGLSTRAISDLERGVNRTPRKATLALLADALHLTADERQRLEQAVQPATPLPLHNLPAPLTSFIGREAEVAAITRLLRQADGRLVTLTGPGGSGKTRLALEVSTAMLTDFPDGIWFVDLAPLTDASLVLPTVAQVLGVQEAGGQPILERVQTYLRAKRLLLVLDNFERLVDAGPQVSTLLQAAPGLQVLATSRVALRLRGEKRVAVPPLALPDLQHLLFAEELAQNKAIRLFVERARDVDSGFTLTDANTPAVAEICVRLGGNAPGEQVADVLAAVDELLAQSMIVRRTEAAGKPRFGMLETLQKYAREQLEASGEAESLRREHAHYFMRLAEEAEPHLTGPTMQAWLDRLEEEHDNIRAALRWARAGGAAEGTAIGLRIGGAIWRFWMVRGYLTEGREALQALVSQAALCDGCKAWSAKAMNGAGALTHMLGEHAVARSLDEHAHTVAREVGDDRSMANALNNLAILVEEQGDNASARALYEQSLAIRRAIGDTWGIGGSLGNLGNIAAAEGDYRAARTLYEQSLAINGSIGYKVGISLQLTNLAHIAGAEGDYARARTLYEQSLAIERDLGHTRGIAGTLINLGRMAYYAGDWATARVLLEQSLVIKREIGHMAGIASALLNLARLASAEEDYAKARALYQESLIVARETKHMRAIVLGLAGLGTVEVEHGRPQRGAILLGAAEAELQAMQPLLTPADRQPYERALGAARAQLVQLGLNKHTVMLLGPCPDTSKQTAWPSSDYSTQ